MELVKAALAEALRLLRLQAAPGSLQGLGVPAPARARYVPVSGHRYPSSVSLGPLGLQINSLSPQQPCSAPRTAAHL